MAIDFPASPSVGATFSSAGRTWVWDGVKWTASGAQGTVAVFVGDNPPSNPQPGVLWYDSTGSQLYLWYNDGNSIQWTPAVNAGGSGGAAGTLNADAPIDGNLYTRQNGLWVPEPQNIGKNHFMNACFYQAQRGTSFTVAGATLDRWQLLFGGSDTVTQSRILLTDADRAAIGDEFAIAALQQAFTASSATGSYNGIRQRIESVYRLSNKSVIISFWAKVTSGTAKIAVVCQQNPGTGGSPSPPTNTPTQTLTITSAWTRYAVLVTFPSIAGKTLGTNGDHSSDVWIQFNNQGDPVLGVQPSNTAQLYGMQCEVALPWQTQPSPLEKVNLRQDLASCQRYYAAYGGITLGSYQTVGGTFYNTFWYPVPMRTTPTVTFANLAQTGASALTVNNSNPLAVTLQASCTATGGCWSQGTVMLSAEI